MQYRQGLTAQVKKAAGCCPASDALSLRWRSFEGILDLERVLAMPVDYVLQSPSLLRVYLMEDFGKLDQSQQT